jgi:hypothetical protein
MYNLYNENKTDDLGGKSNEGVDFYLPIGAILVELQDCSNKLSGIESNTTIDPTIATPVYSCHRDDNNQQWYATARNHEENKAIDISSPIGSSGYILP